MHTLNFNYYITQLPKRPRKVKQKIQDIDKKKWRKNTKTIILPRRELNPGFLNESQVS